MRVVFLFFILFFLSLSGYGQPKKKLSYKEIFVFLGNNQLVEAEPLLKQYLRENANKASANAYMYMGYIYESRFLTADFLKEPQQSAVLGDSAIYYLDLCLKNLDDKDIKRNEEYYQSFSRRDFRSGDYGIKLSDINFELSKKIKSITELRDHRSKLLDQFKTIQESCARVNLRFKDLVGQYATSRELLLRGGPVLLAGLQNLILIQDSLVNTYESFKLVSELAGNNRYLRELQFISISDYRSNDVVCPEYFTAALKLYDYKSWSLQLIDVIDNIIRPAVDELIKVDGNISVLYEQIRKDSVSILNTVELLNKKVNQSALIKYDAEPFPLLILNIKLSELAHGSVKSLGRTIRSSENLPQRLIQDQQELKSLRLVDSLCAVVKTRDLNNDAEDYKYFIQNTFGGLTVLDSYLNATSEYAQQQIHVIDDRTLRLKERLKWIIDGADSIPAQTGVESIKWVPLLTKDEAYTVGLHAELDQAPEGYFYKITGSRLPALHAKFPLDSIVFAKFKLPFLNAQVTGAKDGSVYFAVFTTKESPSGFDNITIAKIYAADGLAWYKSYSFSGIPVQVNYLNDSGELSVMVESSAGQQIHLISKDGTLKL